MLMETGERAESQNENRGRPHSTPGDPPCLRGSGERGKGSARAERFCKRERKLQRREMARRELIRRSGGTLDKNKGDEPVERRIDDVQWLLPNITAVLRDHLPRSP